MMRITFPVLHAMDTTGAFLLGITVTVAIGIAAVLGFYMGRRQ